MANAHGPIWEQIPGGQAGEGVKARAAGPGWWGKEEGCGGVLSATHSQEGKNKQGSMNYSPGSC